jgi:hypothetical protein
VGKTARTRNSRKVGDIVCDLVEPFDMPSKILAHGRAVAVGENTRPRR